MTDEFVLSDADLQAYRDSINPMRHVRPLEAFEHAVCVGMFVPGMNAGKDDTLPWEKTFDNFRFRPGEVTLWHGINGHGKSAVTTQLALFLAINGKASAIASFEMLPVRTVDRMVKQCAGNGMPAEKWVRQFFKALKGRIWIYDKRDRVDRQELFSVIRYCVIEKGVKHFFIDSLMKCVAGEDDYNGQKDFVGDLCALSHELDIHIHLVHHVRKGDESKPPTKFDAKGSGAITDQVDNVLAVWRNKGKEADRQMNKPVDENAPDFMLICDKQRNGGWEGRIALWGDVTSWHFRGQQQQPWTRGYTLPDIPREPGQDEQEAA